MRGLTKTLQTLIERAERNGQAVKRVREGLVSGLYGYYHGDIKDTPLIEQWRVTVSRVEQDGVRYENIIVDHYGTGIAHIVRNLSEGTARLHMVYGESKSDADALDGLCSKYGINKRFAFRPVNGGFQELA